MEEGTSFLSFFPSNEHGTFIWDTWACRCQLWYAILYSWKELCCQACRHTIIPPCYLFWVLFDVSAFIFIEYSGDLCIIALGNFMCITLALNHLERTILLDLLLYIYKAKPSSWWNVWHKLTYNSVNQRKSCVWVCYVWGSLSPCTPFLMKWYTTLMHIWEIKEIIGQNEREIKWHVTRVAMKR